MEVESWDMNSGHWWTLHARSLTIDEINANLIIEF